MSRRQSRAQRKSAERHYWERLFTQQAESLDQFEMMQDRLLYNEEEEEIYYQEDSKERPVQEVGNIQMKLFEESKNEEPDIINRLLVPFEEEIQLPSAEQFENLPTGFNGEVNANRVDKLHKLSKQLEQSLHVLMNYHRLSTSDLRLKHYHTSVYSVLLSEIGKLLHYLDGLSQGIRNSGLKVKKEEQFRQTYSPDQAESAE